MKAITLWQPWASLVATREKKIETRSWSTNYRGKLAIHAAMLNPYKAIKSIPDSIITKMRKALKEKGILTPSTDFRVLPVGCIIATANLVDCHEITYSFRCSKINFTDEEYFGDYTPGRYAWILEDIQPLEEPIPAKGMQKLWNWEG